MFFYTEHSKFYHIRSMKYPNTRKYQQIHIYIYQCDQDVDNITLSNNRLSGETAQICSPPEAWLLLFTKVWIKMETCTKSMISSPSGNSSMDYTSSSKSEFFYKLIYETSYCNFPESREKTFQKLFFILSADS